MPQLRQLWEGNFSGMLCWEGAWLPTQPGAPGRAVLPPKEQTVLSFGYFWLFSCCPMSSSPWLNPATHLSLCRSVGAWLQQEERQKGWSFSLRAVQSSPSVTEVTARAGAVRLSCKEQLRSSSISDLGWVVWGWFPFGCDPRWE